MGKYTESAEADEQVDVFYFCDLQRPLPILFSAAQVNAGPPRAKSADVPPHHPSLAHCMSTPNTSKLLTQSYSPSPSSTYTSSSSKITKSNDDDWGSWDKPKPASSSSQLRSRSTVAASDNWDKW
jgi:hypothetical protein